jgi:hypothetical protein
MPAGGEKDQRILSADAAKLPITSTSFLPVAIPFHGNAIARQINQASAGLDAARRAPKLGFKRPITWTFFRARRMSWAGLGSRWSLYHCTDEFSQFTDHSRDATLDSERR